MVNKAAEGYKKKQEGLEKTSHRKFEPIRVLKDEFLVFELGKSKTLSYGATFGINTPSPYDLTPLKSKANGPHYLKVFKSCENRSLSSFCCLSFI